MKKESKINVLIFLNAETNQRKQVKKRQFIFLLEYFQVEQFYNIFILKKKHNNRSNNKEFIFDDRENSKTT